MIKSKVVQGSAILFLLFGILPTANGVSGAEGTELDPHIHFIENESTIQLKDQHQNHYVTQIESFSKTNMPTYARRDITLIYDQGLLREIIANPQPNADLVQQDRQLDGKDSSRIDVITLHLAEIHDFEENVTQQYAMSEDHLYIFKRALSSSFSSFREPATNTEKEWKKILDRTIEHYWQSRWQKIIQRLDIKKDDYHWLTLNELPEYEDMPLPSFSEQETQRILFQIWKHIYQGYVQVDVQRDVYNQQAISAEGSMMPYIGLARDGSYIRILYMTEGGKTIHLQREIQLP